MEKSKDQIRAHVIIEGMVQGVFFRASAKEQAVRLGLKGWVRNCADGSVELLAEGERTKVQELINWCRHGPPRAEVYNVGVDWQPYRGEFQEFRVTR